MVRNRTFFLVGLAVLVGARCSPPPDIRADPDCVDQGRGEAIAIYGFEPHLFMEASGRTLTVVEDLAVTFVANGRGRRVEGSIQSVTADSIVVAMSADGPIDVGDYDVEVVVRGTTYRGDRVLRVAAQCEPTDAGVDGSPDADLDVGDGADADVVLPDADHDAPDGDASETEEPADGDLDAECEDGAERCGGDVLEVCVGGRWETGEECTMGCAADGSRCLEALPSGPPGDLGVFGEAELELSSEAIFDTDTGRIADADGVELRGAGEGELAGVAFTTIDGDCLGVGVFAFERLTVQPGAILRGVGSRGLVVLTRARMDLHGDVTVSASGLEAGAGGYLGGARGEPGDGPSGGQAGESWTSCCDSGGGGGGHVGGGGSGGSSRSATGGSGGSVSGSETLVPLCGGSGGGGEEGVFFADQGSEGGGGGGALQLFSADAVIVHPDGSVRASGGGGSGGHPGGGGGGGAAGAILIEAPTVEVAGALVANGGGGGSGGHLAGFAGADGDDGGSGGVAGPLGAEGGSGGVGDLCDGDDGLPSDNNGGGGGGSAGRLRLNARDAVVAITGSVSPTTYSVGPVAGR